MVISVEDMLLDRPVLDVLKELLVLDEKDFSRYLFDGSEFCLFSSGKLIRFNEPENFSTRASCASSFIDFFLEDEIKEFRNFILCNVAFKGAFYDENHLLSDWYLEYLEFRANYKSFSAKNRRLVLFISHFHEKDEKGMLICPHLHILYNKSVSKNSFIYLQG